MVATRKIRRYALTKFEVAGTTSVLAVQNDDQRGGTDEDEPTRDDGMAGGW